MVCMFVVCVRVCVCMRTRVSPHNNKSTDVKRKQLVF